MGCLWIYYIIAVTSEVTQFLKPFSKALSRFMQSKTLLHTHKNWHGTPNSGTVPVFGVKSTPPEICVVCSVYKRKMYRAVPEKHRYGTEITECRTRFLCSSSVKPALIVVPVEFFNLCHVEIISPPRLSVQMKTVVFSCSSARL